VLAAETLANHIRCNNSFVQAVFQAQFRSSLTCPRCHKQSNTFDPFHCISVQLPQLQQQSVFVKVIYLSQQPRQVKLGLKIPQGSPLIALREQLQADTGIPQKRLIIAEINESGFSRIFCDSHAMSSIAETDPIYCIETPEPPADVTTKTTSDEGAITTITLCVANIKKVGKSIERFGTPFCIQVNRDISYLELQQQLLKELSSTLKSEVLTCTTKTTDSFRIYLQDPSADPDTYLEESVRVK
jgi:ubiquitin carboxyl-terminal hydrolase 31